MLINCSVVYCISYLKLFKWKISLSHKIQQQLSQNATDSFIYKNIQYQSAHANHHRYSPNPAYTPPPPHLHVALPCQNHKRDTLYWMSVVISSFFGNVRLNLADGQQLCREFYHCDICVEAKYAAGSIFIINQARNIFHVSRMFHVI